MTAPLVSVLIPCFNAERTIGETLESVLAQTWPSVETIVVDDGSTDGGAEVIAKFRPNGVSLIRQANAGAAAARNRALELAHGEWCVFLDADDSFDADFLRVQVEAVRSDDADICFGDSRLTWPDGRTIECVAMPSDSTTDFALSRVLSDGWYPPDAILWRAQFCVDIGGWDSALSRNDDGELIARALLRSSRITSSHGPCAVYRQHDGAGRVSARRDRSAIESNVVIIERLERAMAERHDLPLGRRSLARQAHEIATDAYFIGFDDLGERAEAIARRYGPLQPLPRSRLHALGETLLGVRGKAKLSRLRAESRRWLDD